MSKLDSMIGKARPAIARFIWKDFTLQAGMVYGRDLQGRLFASSGVSAAKYGHACPKPGHIIVYRCINEREGMPIIERKTIWGANSRAIGRRPIIAPAGAYAAPWAYIWRPEQVHIKSALGREILKVVSAYHRSTTSAAKLGE